MNMRHFIRSLSVASLLLCSTPTFADWNPDYLENVDTSVLTNPDYQSIKKSVLKEVEGSWCSQEKAGLMMDLVLLTRPEVCVEIGAWTGSSVLPVARTLRFLKSGKIYAIDAWSNAVATRYWDDNDPNKPWWSTVNMKQIHKTFQNMITSWKLEKYCKEIVLPSEEAVNYVNSIDFLHLDGDYSEKGSMEDVTLYFPKVRSGGYILISHLFTMINGKQPKLKSFVKLLEECEIVCEIERDNAILFRKY